MSANKEFSASTRVNNLQQMREQKFDLVIIGGGINGAGVARDAASRGMRVALVEMSDFASGTSSRSSKLIHGGIRYLEHLEFGLVYEALSERSKLFKLAPHLVHPLRFLLPMYKGDRVGMFKMGLGMWAYDILSLFEAPEMHERLSPGESLQRVPSLRESGLEGSYVYSDAYMDDDRLVLETLRSANNFGALCVNFVKALSADFATNLAKNSENSGTEHFTPQKMVALTCRDEKTGQEFKLRGKHFISTVGPWTDQVGSKLLTTWENIMRPSKGVHLTFRRDRFPLPCAAVLATGADNRIVFAIPRHEMIVVGTTDTDFKEDPSEVRSLAEDVEYILRVVTDYFPGAKLKKSDIIASYAGVRPLVDDGSRTESGTSREHVIVNDPRNITFVAGGKYTTYRHMAEQTVESALSFFSIEEQVQFNKSQTNKALNPEVTEHSFVQAQYNISLWAEKFGIVESEVKELVERFGPEALRILSRQSKSLDSRWLLEAQHALDNTMCLNLEDFFLRRTPLFLSTPDHGLSQLSKISRLFAEHHGWSEVELEQQIESYKHQIQRELYWQK